MWACRLPLVVRLQSTTRSSSCHSIYQVLEQGRSGAEPVRRLLRLLMSAKALAALVIRWQGALRNLTLLLALVLLVFLAVKRLLLVLETLIRPQCRPHGRPHSNGTHTIGGREKARP